MDRSGNPLIDKAQSLKRAALSELAWAQSTGDDSAYRTSLNYIEEAIHFLRSDWEVGESTTLATELADCFGIAGGIQRRLGQYQLAIGFYDEGKYYEINPNFGTEGSYNLCNALALRILDKPQDFSILRPDLEKAYDILRKQVEGSRFKDWWGWADLGMVSLLLGRAEEAFNAYNRFVRTGARAQDIKSAATVIAELAGALFEDPIAPLLNEALKLLQTLNRDPEDIPFRLLNQKSLAAVDIRSLLDKLNHLAPTQLGILVLILNVPPGVMPEGVTHGERVYALIKWAQNAADSGLAKVQEEIEKILRSY